MSENHSPAKTDHPPSADHASGAVPTHHDMHLGLYKLVGVFLLVATAITVWLSYVDFGSRAANITVAMIVATIKVGFVAAIFMHLKGEKWTIWKFLILTIFFAVGLFFLTLLHYADPIFGTKYNMH